MRYLILICSLLLSSFSFADSPPPEPICPNQTVLGCMSPSFLAEVSSACASGAYGPQGYFSPKPCAVAIEGYSAGVCKTNCTCPAGYVFNTVINAGVYSSSCIPDEPTETTECEGGAAKVYDPVSGTLVCPGSGDSSSAGTASSQSCVVPGDLDGDCVPDDSSSAANSSPPASAANSSPPSSSGGDSSSGGGGGGGGGGGSGNGGAAGAGSGSSAAAQNSSTPSGSNSSWTPHSGYGNWIPVSEDSNCPNKYKDTSGQWWCAGSGSPSTSSTPAMALEGSCDYTSKNYFSCITSQIIPGSGSNSSWVPVSGYGNWIPVNENSNCVNKFQDKSGQWWCAGGNSAGSGGSGGSSAGSGSGSSASGECDSTSRDYLDCISSGKSSRSSGSSSSSNSSGSASSTSNQFSSLGEKGEFDGEASEKRLEELKEELEKKIADIKNDVSSEFGGAVSGSGSIQDFCKSIRDTEVCFGLEKFEPYLDPIASAIFLVACVISFVIVLRG